MKVAFRADASLQIGAGHVMRCLTLADVLRDAGAQCRFICRDWPGNLAGLIKRQGYQVDLLPLQQDDAMHESTLPHSAWLGVPQGLDATQCLDIIEQQDWLIVDHYGIDIQWERVLRQRANRILVIDDLVDRSHDCDFLLDQTFSRAESQYRELVPGYCRLLCGSRYALLRPEFARMRKLSLGRRQEISKYRNFLVSLGGVDSDNVTGNVLSALRDCALPSDCRITVVLGETAPCVDNVRLAATTLPYDVRVEVGVNDMASLMAESDIAIGAAGATSWERCCLGLPSIIVVLAANQVSIAEALEKSHAAAVVYNRNDIPVRLPELIGEILSSPERGVAISRAAAAITDGQGATVVASMMGF